jgi:hypothetical protein
MIRIDEIYENTFLPWVRKNCPDSAMFYCDPFGRSDPDSILCRGLDNSANEKQSIFFFDQEPVQVTTHIPTFDRFIMSTGLINPDSRFLICSETNSDNVDYICKRFNLRPFYYFFHGWAALDWFRGYDRTFLITPLKQRSIKKTFFSPNRIIGGERKHRVLMLYFMAGLNLLDNNISAPAICPVENQSIQEIAEYFKHYWPNPESGIMNNISQMDLPRFFPNEETQRMSSCWLDQFDLAAESLIYHVSETVYFGRRQHLTEKTFKPIAMGMPFILNAPAGSLAYLKSYGFKTFDSVWDESYDQNINDYNRIENTAKILQNINRLSLDEKQKLFEKCIPIIEHNWNHFYGGGFEKILWAELTAMLDNLKAAVQGDLSSN